MMPPLPHSLVLVLLPYWHGRGMSTFLIYDKLCPAVGGVRKIRKSSRTEQNRASLDLHAVITTTRRAAP